MRKIDPAGVKQDFEKFAIERLQHYSRLETLLKNSPNEKRDLSVLSETILHSTYVAFEVFISDLLLAYMNRDFSQYQADLKNRMHASITSKFGIWAAGRVKFDSIKHIGMDDLEQLIDPTGWNSTFKSTSDMQNKFKEWVSPNYTGGVLGLADDEILLIDTARAIRNFIAHNSSGSKAKMNDCLSTISTGSNCRNNILARGIHKIDDIGAYLKSVVSGQRRIVLIIDRLRNIAASM